MTPWAVTLQSGSAEILLYVTTVFEQQAREQALAKARDMGIEVPLTVGKVERVIA